MIEYNLDEVSDVKLRQRLALLLKIDDMRLERYKSLGIDVMNTNPDGSDWHLMNAVDTEIDMTMRGTSVRTKKGAAFRGIELVHFLSLNGAPHLAVEAIDPGFERCIHIYPVAQMEQWYNNPMDPSNLPQGAGTNQDDKPATFGGTMANNLVQSTADRPFGADGVHVAGRGKISLEEFEKLKNAT